MGCTASRLSTSLPPEKSPQDFFYPSPLKDLLSNQSFSDISKPSSGGTYATGFPLKAPLVHHLPSRKGDSHHVVSLKSTTYGYLRLETDSPPKMNLKDADWCNDEALSPDSVINTWELMDGLEEDDMTSQRIDFSEVIDESFKKSKPLWKHLSEESLLSSMDPNVVSSYIRALSFKKDYHNDSKYCPSDKAVKVVFYFTSLRGIRQTYEDCCFVRALLRSFQIAVDERDISMDLTFKNELKEIFKDEPIKLPQVFVRGKHVGSAEEMKKLNEEGELTKLLKGFPIKDQNLVCTACGDARFIPCSNCSGSRRIFDEDEEQMKKCSECNENGLLRCPICCTNCNKPF